MRRSIPILVVLLAVAAIYGAALAGLFGDPSRMRLSVPFALFEGDMVSLTCHVPTVMRPVRRVSWRSRGRQFSGTTCPIRFQAPAGDLRRNMHIDVRVEAWHGGHTRGSADLIIEPKTHLTMAYMQVVRLALFTRQHALLVASRVAPKLRIYALTSPPRTFEPGSDLSTARGSELRGFFAIPEGDPTSIVTRAGPCGGFINKLFSGISASLCKKYDTRGSPPLIADTAQWVASEDRPHDTVCIQHLGQVRMTMATVEARMRAAEQQTNRIRRTYRSGGPNSNSYAFSVSERLLGYRPTPASTTCIPSERIRPKDVPGWGVQVL